jgi:ribosomal protein S18 acetylase RimI-like enzyme
VSNTIIRRATSKDVPELVALLQSCAADMSSQGMHHWLGVYDESSVAGNLTSKMVFVLECDAKLLACIALGTEPADYYQDCWPDAPKADYYITQLAVRPDCQGSGYGKQLVQFCLQQVGHHSLQLDAVDHYPALLRFYRSLGFEVIATGIGLGDKRHLFRFNH